MILTRKRREDSDDADGSVVASRSMMGSNGAVWLIMEKLRLNNGRCGT